MDSVGAIGYPRIMDWGDGSYERTAATLEPASVRALDALQIARGIRVIDLGAGTGNAALEAARRGASVLAVEPAARLLEVCRARAAREDLPVEVKQGDASRIPADDSAFDALVSVFAVIFAPDAEVAADEMLRVVRPGGRVVVTTWSPRGPISQAGSILREAMAVLDPASKTRVAPAWGDPSFVRPLFERRGARVAIEEESLSFEAESPEAWFTEQEENHPIWRGTKAALSALPGGEWDRVRERSIAALRAGNEEAARMRVTSHYLVVTATR